MGRQDLNHIDTLSKPVFLCLDVSNNGIKEPVENKPVFDPDFHTELIIKDEFEDLDSGNFDFCKKNQKH